MGDAKRIEELEELCAMVQQDKEQAVRAMESQMAVEAAQSQRLREEVRRLRADKARLEQTARDGAKRIEELERDVARLAGKSAAAPAVSRDKAYIEQKHASSTTLPTTEGSAGGRAGSSLESRVADLEREIEQLRAREAEREELLKETTDALYEWKDECELLQHQLTEYEEELQILSEEAEGRGAAGGRAPSSGETTRLRAKLRQTEDKLRLAEEDLREAQAAADTSLAAARKEMESQLAGERTASQAMAEAHAAEIATSKGKITSLEEEVNGLKARLREALGNLDEATTALQVVREVEASLRAGYAACEQRRGALEGEVRQMNEETSMLGDWSRSVMRTMSKL